MLDLLPPFGHQHFQGRTARIKCTLYILICYFIYIQAHGFLEIENF